MENKSNLVSFIALFFVLFFGFWVGLKDWFYSLIISISIIVIILIVIFGAPFIRKLLGAINIFKLDMEKIKRLKFWERINEIEKENNLLKDKINQLEKPFPKKFSNGDILTANTMNEIFNRLEKLEKQKK